MRGILNMYFFAFVFFQSYLVQSQKLNTSIESDSILIGKELFYKIYDYCTAGEHDFMFIDMFRKKSHPSMFRRCLDEFVIPEEFKSQADST